MVADLRITQGDFLRIVQGGNLT